MSFNLMEYLQEETQNGLLDRCYINFVTNVVLEYDDYNMHNLVKKWDLDEFKVWLMRLKKDDESNVVYATSRYISQPCNHAHTVRVTIEKLNGEIEETAHSCTNCGKNLTEEENDHRLERNGNG